MRFHRARTRTLSSALSTTAVLAVLTGGCGGSPPNEDVGQAVIAITKAPTDTRCLIVTVAGARTVTRKYDLTPGQSTIVTLTGLPIGSDAFTAEAYSEACNQIAATSQADWVSDPVSVNVTGGLLANVVLVMHRNGLAQVAVDFQEDDGGAGIPVLSLPGTRPPPLAFSHTLDVTIDHMDPAVPLEGRPVIVYFTATNHTASTVSGRALANITSPAGAALQSSAWSVTSLAAGASMRGVLLFDAPGAAPANGIEVFIEDPNHTHLASRTDTFDTAARYTFSIPTVHIDNPRSTETDSDYLIFAGEVDQSLVFNKSQNLGNGGAGHDFGLHDGAGQIVPGFGGTVGQPAISESEPLDVVPDTGPVVTVAALTLNWGFSHPATPDVLTSLGAGFLDGSITSINIVDLPAWVFSRAFDCDGVVAAERRQWSSRDLLDATPYAPIQSIPDLLGSSAETRAYHGYNSPPACGAVSNYHMTWGITRWGVGYDNLVTVTPKTRVLVRNQSANFTATLAGPVIWSVDGGVSNGTIDQNGHYVAPSTLSANDFVTIRATAGDGSGRAGLAFVSYANQTAVLSTCLPGACN